MLALTIANLKMMVRNRQTTFWALFFPLLLVVVFGLFNIVGPGAESMAVIDEANTPRSRLLQEKLEAIESLKLEASPNSVAAARELVSAGELDYALLIPQEFGLPDPQTGSNATRPVTLIYVTGNPERTQLLDAALSSMVLETASDAAPATSPPALVVEGIDVPEVAYFDVLLLGLVGLSIMTNSIISIAVKISTYRNQSILKRMLVTPLAIWKYFAAEITAHLMLALVQAAIILAVGVFIFGAQIHGNLLWLFIIVLMGGLVFLNIGFILSAWTSTPSAASAMGNAIALPMLFLAGTFFSTSSLPWLLPYVSQVLPLTPMLSAMREVAIDSTPIWQVWPQLGALGGWVAATALVAVKVFRFN